MQSLSLKIILFTILLFFVVDFSFAQKCGIGDTQCRVLELLKAYDAEKMGEQISKNKGGEGELQNSENIDDPKIPKTAGENIPEIMKSALPEEGGEVDKNEMHNKFVCNKPQNATKCKKIPLTDVVFKSGGTGFKQIVCSANFCDDGLAGTKYVKPKGEFMVAKENGQYMTKKAVPKRIKNGAKTEIVWKLDQAILIQNAVTPKSDIIFK